MERTRDSMILAAFVMMIFPSGCSRILASASPWPEQLTFTYYLHDDFVPPDTTGVQVASANGTFTRARLFGDVNVFDTPIRLGAEKDSALLGGAGGNIEFLKAGINYISFVHNLTINDYAGTIAGSGRFNSASSSWEVSVTGGTGSFRGANGYSVVSLADPDPTGFIIKYETNLLLPKWRN